MSEEAAVQEIMKKTQQQLKRFGIDVTQSADKHSVLHFDNTALSSVSDATWSEKLGANTVALLFGTKSLSAKAKTSYWEAKTECLMVGNVEAAQWFDLSKQSVWNVKERGLDYAIQNVVLALIAKLGHVPFAVDATRWLRPREVANVAVAGYDVCHLPDPKSPGNRVHVAAGVRVSSDTAGSMTMSRIEPQSKRIEGESVPLAAIKTLIPPEFANGRVVIIHRDGVFRVQEKLALKRYHRRQLKAGTCLVLVEIVKYAGGTSRLYNIKGNVAGNPDEGSFLLLSNKEAILTSSEKVQGTVNPLNVRLAGVISDDGEYPSSLDELAWVMSVFDLSFLHHGSLYKDPRLPVTTHFADKLAYQLANGGRQWDEKLDEKPLGQQQFWL